MDGFLYDNGLCHKKVKYFWEHRGKGTIQNHPNYVLLHFLLSFQNVNFQKVLCAGLISVCSYFFTYGASEEGDIPFQF